MYAMTYKTINLLHNFVIVKTTTTIQLIMGYSIQVNVHEL